MPSAQKPPQTKTDWARVKQDYRSDSAIEFNAEDELYDPNDKHAVTAAWASGKVSVGVRGKHKAPATVPSVVRVSLSSK